MKKNLLILFSLIVSSVAYAENSFENGKTKAAVCVGCHGEDGLANIPSYPNLAGQNYAYLEKQLLAFKSGDRNDPIMSPMAKNLVKQDIKDIAAYYANLKTTP